MTPKEDLPKEEKSQQVLEEICENTRAIRRVVNRIFDHLHEQEDENDEYDPDTLGWSDLCDNDDMYY